MVPRTLSQILLNRCSMYPVVTLTGPRQSGKTTLCRALFPDKPYFSLEASDTRAFAADDPRGFLAQCRGGAVLDEVQRVPDLMVKGASGWHLVEAKSGQTLNAEFFQHLQTLKAELAEGSVAGSHLVYGGPAAMVRSGVAVTPWASIQAEAWD